MRRAFIHCSLAHNGVWAPLLKALGEDDPILIELPGHGQAPDWDAAQDYQDQALDAALSALPEQPVALVGHSFGGTVALRLAVEAPRRVAHLTLIEPVFFAAAREAGDPAYNVHALAFQPFLAAMANGDRESAARIFTELWGAGMPWGRIPQAQRQYLVDRIHLIPAGAPAIEEDRADLLRPGRLEALKMPVHLIEGAASPQVVGAIQGELSRRIQGASRDIVDGAGHMLPITHPGVVADLLQPKPR
ncbi:alpha/beta fold hydrolase [Aestuariibius sp. 2305UL40-4]|uniref:alpha/beta fold hydrolase n=1 Tax=Aestuariibius violaceus TaxID=3234132 RepID=UPI00345E3E48